MARQSILSREQKEALKESLRDAFFEAELSFLKGQMKNPTVLTSGQAELIMEAFAEGWLVDEPVDPFSKCASRIVAIYEDALKQLG